MSYLPTKTGLGAVPSSSTLKLGAALAAVALVGVVVFWPGGPKKKRKSWLRYNTAAKRACQLPSKRVLSPPSTPITC